MSFIHIPQNGGPSRRVSSEDQLHQTIKQSPRERDSDAEAEAKKRRVQVSNRSSHGKLVLKDIQRACDICRRKKIKCEGPMTSASASKYGQPCTYVEAAKRRGPPKGYVDTLEHRVKRLEHLLLQASHTLSRHPLMRQLHPDVDFTPCLGPPLDREEFDLAMYQDTLSSLHIPPYPAMKPFVLPSHTTITSPAPAPSPSLRMIGPAPWRSYDQDTNRPASVDEEEKNEARMHVNYAKALAKLNVGDEHWRFLGKASGAHMIRALNDLKSGSDEDHFLETLKRHQRAQYWQVPEWETVISLEGLAGVDWTVWPEPGLDLALIDAYFTYANIHYPLLNRVIFENQYLDGYYRSSSAFAKVCWMVFANGARFVDDDRVYWSVDEATTEEGKERLRADKDGTLKYSAGWKYLRALRKMGKSWLQLPSLPEIQCQVLICMFLMGNAVPHLTWLACGAGLRASQEIGIHVRATLLHADPIERALYNRAFWCLYHIDRISCAAIGRSVTLHDSDFDADYPIAVDDEYWQTGDSELDFRQPESAGVPKIAGFIHLLKLDYVLGAALQTIYAINKTPEQRGDTASQREIVVELDSALNSWADSVPDALRWDPSRQNQTLFGQSAILFAHYHYCQILIHRPFIRTNRHPLQNVKFPSLAICSNAARSIANILDAVLRRARQLGTLPGRSIDVCFTLPAMTAAAILLIGVYSGQQHAAEREKTLQDVRKCIFATQEVELSWRQAGKMTDLMTALVSDEYLNSDHRQLQTELPNHSSSEDVLATAYHAPQALSPVPNLYPVPMMDNLDTAQQHQQQLFNPNIVNPLESFFTSAYGQVMNYDIPTAMPTSSIDDRDLWTQLFGNPNPNMAWPFAQRPPF
ncbi:hypothetical protein P7C73_g2646, partial [Tremellales sp. Uapishka_1]